MPQPKCPNCSKPSTPEHKPFCSKRCQEVDLHRWLTGQYAIPAEEPPDSEILDEEPNPPA